jgi:hypothetical protein
MNKHLNNWLDKVEGLKIGTTNKNIKKEIKRQYPSKNKTMKNLCAKTVKRENAYEVWENVIPMFDCPIGSWRWYVLKKWQIDDNKEYARWFCDVVTPICPDGELGDTYVADIKSVAKRIK